MNQEEIRKLSAVEDHSRVFGKLKYVYPVISRRSEGLSLGVNLNPNRHCSFDCIYCEVDRSRPLAHFSPSETVDLAQLEEELSFLIELALKGELAKMPKFAEAGELTRHVRDIAFSGEGEPTLSPSFPGAVDVVGSVRKRFNLQESKVVLITNASALHVRSVYEALDVMMGMQGRIWAKLDAGTPSYYKQINRSLVPFERILSNIDFAAHRVPLYIQTMFLKLNGQGMPQEELEAYCHHLATLLKGGAQLLGIQAYTIARPTYGRVEPGLIQSPLSRAELEAVGEFIHKQVGLPVDCFA